MRDSYQLLQIDLIWTHWNSCSITHTHHQLHFACHSLTPVPISIYPWALCYFSSFDSYMNFRVFSFFILGPMYLSIQRNRTFFGSVPFQTISLLGEMNGIYALLLPLLLLLPQHTLLCVCANVGEFLRLGVIHGADHITNEEKHPGKQTKIIVAW